RSPAATLGEHVEVLEFAVGGERYAIETCYAAEVMALAQCVQLPNVPAHVLGVIHLHGRMVSVMDLRVLFGMPIGDLPERNYLVVLRSEAMEFGILAHRIEGIVTLEWSSLVRE